MLILLGAVFLKMAFYETINYSFRQVLEALYNKSNYWSIDMGLQNRLNQKRPNPTTICFVYLIVICFRRMIFRVLYHVSIELLQACHDHPGSFLNAS
jgi:hypothetical protein